MLFPVPSLPLLRPLNPTGTRLQLRSLLLWSLLLTLVLFSQSTPAAPAQTEANPRATTAAKKPVANRNNQSTSGKARQKAAANKRPNTKPATQRVGSQAAAAGDKQATSYAHVDAAMQWADEVAQRRELDRTWVRQTIAQARKLPSVIRASTPPPVGQPKNWKLYRSLFIDAIRIRAGVRFWNENRETLQRAESETGVPAAIIVGVIGVETIYGQQTGSYRVIDALSTLSFDFPAAHPRAQARSAYFRSELEEFLALTARTKTDPLALRGSYAGAMGMPQFMPSSWSRYGVDFDGDNRVDLFLSPQDVIGSVANYFRSFQWQPGMPTHYPVSVDTRSDMKTLLGPDILPSFSTEDFARLGAQLDSSGQQHQGPLALIELQNGAEAPTYVAGTQNFYAITRYNWSSYYAMAVIELGQAVAAALPQ